MTPDDPAEVHELERWLASGGEARVLGHADGETVVGLFTCDGGEQMGRVTLPDQTVGTLLGQDSASRPFG